jgi:phosphate starvation-inducible PhoH-like protein
VSDESVTRKLNTEGADLLTLAGVNDTNLIELARIGGVKVSLRGETMTLTGPEDLIDRAQAIGQRMIEIARQRRDLTADDVLRLGDAADNFDHGESGNGTGGILGGPRISLPGIRKVIEAKTPGQAEYMRQIQENDIVVGIGPAGTGKTYLAVAAAVDALTKKRVRRIVLLSHFVFLVAGLSVIGSVYYGASVPETRREALKAPNRKSSLTPRSRRIAAPSTPIA